MIYAVWSAFFGMVSSFFAVASAARRKQWLSAFWRTLIFVTSVFGFLAAVHASQKKKASKTGSAKVSAS